MSASLSVEDGDTEEVWATKPNNQDSVDTSQLDLQRPPVRVVSLLSPLVQLCLWHQRWSIRWVFSGPESDTAGLYESRKRASWLGSLSQRLMSYLLLKGHACVLHLLNHLLHIRIISLCPRRCLRASGSVLDFWMWWTSFFIFVEFTLLSSQLMNVFVYHCKKLQPSKTLKTLMI